MQCSEPSKILFLSEPMEKEYFSSCFLCLFGIRNIEPQPGHRGKIVVEVSTFKIVRFVILTSVFQKVSRKCNEKVTLVWYKKGRNPGEEVIIQKIHIKCLLF